MKPSPIALAPTPEFNVEYLRASSGNCAKTKLSDKSNFYRDFPWDFNQLTVSDIIDATIFKAS